MDNQGWVSIHRKISENKLWLVEPFTKGQAWIDLIMLANHKDGFVQKRGILVEVKRGQVGWSELSLSKRWKWSRGKLKRFIKTLKTEQQIEQQINKVCSLITIINYDQYQKIEQQTGQQTDNKRTTNGQQTDTNNNDNNENNDNKERKIYKKKKSDKDTFLDFIKLTKEENEKLKNTIGTKYNNYMQRLNGYLGSTGKKYKSHYHTILNWARKDGINTDQQGMIMSKRTGKMESLNPKDYPKWTLEGRLTPEQLREYHMNLRDNFSS